MTASSFDGSTGNGSQFLKRNSFRPWNSPQSTRIDLPPISSRCLEPVTVPAAPKKVSDDIRLQNRTVESELVRDYRLPGKSPLHPVELRPDEVIQQWKITRCRKKRRNRYRDVISSRVSSPPAPSPP